MDMIKLGLAMKEIRRLKNLVSSSVLSTDEEKVAGIFISIAFNPSYFSHVAHIIGIDKFDEIARSTSLEELAQKLLDLELFKTQIDINYYRLDTMVKAWNECRTIEGFYVERFVKTCIDALTGTPNPLTYEPDEEVDIDERERLYLKYGLEG